MCIKSTDTFSVTTGTVIVPNDLMCLDSEVQFKEESVKVLPVR